MIQEKKKLKMAIDVGIFDPYLPVEQLWIVYAYLGVYSGWAIVGAKSINSAKYYIKKPGTGWISQARISDVRNIKDTLIWNEYEKLKKVEKIPTELGEWFELEWGY